MLQKGTDHDGQAAPQSEAPKLIHHLRGDLDWIVMKCLEKDRARRYETANGLASGHQRHLEQRTGRWPVRRADRIGSRKLVRRNKLAFGGGVGLASILLLGTVISMGEALRARRAEQDEVRLRIQATRREGALKDWLASWNWRKQRCYSLPMIRPRP